jgi:hypothetical protein
VQGHALISPKRGNGVVNVRTHSEDMGYFDKSWNSYLKGRVRRQSED